ncbi:MAG: response regulator [Actinobacteria bacterium]|nr:response regulator [Actinomycetota bacterium]MBV8599361.1 response regulator [Actinomycetota bacterium]
MSRTIVIADDEPFILGLLRATLKGLDAVEADDGVAALAAVREHAPAILIVDADMPGLDGFEVARTLRADADGPQPRILMLTAAGRQSDRDRADEVGVDEYLTKPFSPSALRARVEELLDG